MRLLSASATQTHRNILTPNIISYLRISQYGDYSVPRPHLAAQENTTSPLERQQTEVEWKTAVAYAWP